MAARVHVLIKNNSSILCFIFIPILQLLCYKVEGELQGIGSSDPILAFESDDVILPCHGEPPDDMFTFVLEWSKLKQHSDPNDHQAKVDYVHIYRDGVEFLDEKMHFYINRTSLSDDGLRRGDMSLKISNVTVADSGMYKCFIPTLGNQNLFTLVNLVVTTKTPSHPNKSGYPRQFFIGLLFFCSGVTAQISI